MHGASNAENADADHFCFSTISRHSPLQLDPARDCLGMPTRCKVLALCVLVGLHPLEPATPVSSSSFALPLRPQVSPENGP